MSKPTIKRCYMIHSISLDRTNTKHSYLKCNVDCDCRHKIYTKVFLPKKKGVYLSVHHTKPLGVQDNFVSKKVLKSNQCKYHVYMLCNTTIVIGVQPHHADSHEYTFFNIKIMPSHMTLYTSYHLWFCWYDIIAHAPP